MMQLVIPMSGTGERFRRAGYREIKPLITAGGRPIIELLLERFPRDWPTVFICDREQLRATRLRATLKRLRPRATLVAIAPHKLGPVHAVLAAGAAVRDRPPTLVNYCDFSFCWDSAHFARFARESACDGAILCYRGFHPHHRGPTLYAYCREEGGRVLEVREKACFTADRTREFASSGSYYFRSGALAKRAFREAVAGRLAQGGEYYASLAYNPIIRRGGVVRIYEIDCFLQWGTPEDLEDYEYWHRGFAAWREAERGRLRAPARRPRLIMPMAGRGRRFGAPGLPPKPLIPVLGRPMFRAAIERLPCSGESPVLVALAADAEAVRRAAPEARIVELPGVTEGPALTTLAAEDAVPAGAEVLVSACDHGLIVDGRRWDALLAKKPDLVVVGQRGYPGARAAPEHYAYVAAGPGGRIERVAVKEPLGATPWRDLVLVGTFYFRRAATLFALVRKLAERGPRVDGELYLDSVVNLAVEAGLDARVLESEAYLCWGTPEALESFRYWHRYFRGYRP